MRGALGLLAFLLLSGCVKRNLVIISDPPGAKVRLDTMSVGYAPLTQPFSHYGARRVDLELRDYARCTRIVEVDPPWYLYFPLDTFFDIAWPFTIEDNHVIHLTMDPLEPEDSKKLEERAQKAREELREAGR